MSDYEEFFSKKDLGIKDNKLVRIENIDSISIRKFRSFQDRTVKLGRVVTVLVGRNGTMKTSLMGLLAHPFESKSNDAFGKELKTQFREVLNLSAEHDRESYTYYLNIKVCDEPRLLAEQVRVYFVGGKTKRHRVVLSGGEAGDGNFSYNTSFLNMKRLLPMVDINARPALVELSDVEKEIQQDFYESVFSKDGFGSFSAVSAGSSKTTFGPVGVDATFGYESISSGEDNLGAIFNKMVGYIRSFDKKSSEGNGIFCIDEFEASLHPVAQIKLFSYLYRWAEKYKVQLVLTTHSLHLIQDIYNDHSENMSAERVVINFFSCSSTGRDNNYEIIVNPNHNLAYKELTFKNPTDVVSKKKIAVFLEDDIACMFFKKIVKKRNLVSLFDCKFNFSNGSNSGGTAYTALSSLCINFPDLLKESVVVFDADVNSDITKKIKKNNVFLSLPDQGYAALERRMVAFIVGLQNDDQFFKKFNKERSIFLSEFKSSGVKKLDVQDVLDEKKTKIDVCKNWVKNVGAVEFKKYVGHYCDNELDKNYFLQLLESRLNEINKIRGLPSVVFAAFK